MGVRKPRLKSAETDALGHRSQVVYDARGRQIETIDPLGGRWKKEYDDAGRVIAEENPMGERTNHEFDADGRLIKTIDPLGRFKQFVFDADNNQIVVVEPDGTTRAKEYNTKNDVIAEAAIAGDPASRVQYVRDVAGKIVQYIDERGNPRHYAYNLKGELIQITDALDNQINFTRNVDGDITHKAYSGAGAIDYVFDLSRRLVEKRLSQASVTETSRFAYDGANQLQERGAWVAGQFFLYDYGYDLAGRESENTMNPGDQSFYHYDLGGKRTAIVVPGLNYRVDYLYDPNHRPVQMTTNEGEIWYFNWDNANRRTSTVYPDGSVKFTFYDLAGQITEEWARDVAGNTIFREQSTFDLRGNIVAQTTNDESRAYTYNLRDWLTSMTVIRADGKGYEQIMTYDASGNMTGQRIQSLSGSKLPFSEVFPPKDGSPALTENMEFVYVYNAADQLVSETILTASGSIYNTAYTWDGAGNMKSKTVSGPKGSKQTVFNWTAENRMSGSTGAVAFTNVPLLEGAGKEQNTWSALRSDPNFGTRVERLGYDHVARHILARANASDGQVGESYVVGPNRDELLAYNRRDASGGFSRAYAYGNFRNDVLAVRSADNAKLVEDRTYLPTGVALTTAKNATPQIGPPGHAQLPPQFPAQNLPQPLMFGWQGKAQLRIGAKDYTNRVLNVIFQSVDALSEDPIHILASQQADKLYAAYNNNGITYSDADGLWSTKNCWSTEKTYVDNAMNTYVRAALNSSCINNDYSRGKLRNVLGTIFNNVVVDCNWAGRYPTKACNASPCGCSAPFISKIFVKTSTLVWGTGCAEFQVSGASKYAQTASTLLHEMVHVAGRTD